MKTKYYSLFFSIRLSILLCCVTSALLFILSYIIERSFDNYSVQQNVTDVNAVINSINTELFLHNPRTEYEEFEQNTSLILAAHNGLYAYIIDKDGNTIYRTRGPDLALVQQHNEFNYIIENGNTAIWNYNDRSYRIAAARISNYAGDEYTVITGVGRTLQQKFIQQLRDGLRILVLISCITTFIWTISTVYLTQKPLNRLSKKIQSITSRHLSYRIPTSIVPAKFIGIVQAFNDMLARIDDVFQRQSNFTADIAHEMRTPITNLVTQTQIALRTERTVEEYQEILYSNLEEYERLSKMITDMLFLAQTDNKKTIPEAISIDLTEEIKSIFEYFEPVAEEQNVSFVLQGNAPVIQGDRAMLSRAIGNLLSNAIRYTPSGESITVSLSQVDKYDIQIVVQNPGKKISSEHLPKLFDRFYRPDESRNRNDGGSGSGAGIGLAIVKSIIDIHQGSIWVESDDDSTRFIIHLPINMLNKRPTKKNTKPQNHSSVN
ncbi:heavy metal sensor histidine kinase [Zophobihabitans entericus]|uniref:Sensor protein n=1 Tax=Zophobihabitans entericus TaxID=1635327 RepID=A0A6G9ICE4_9GAMM|nr:heavy metal sensor histidine kinase [Zophobihabitans entericus]QIQ21489.1 heavy metal sensor histidine kinase [Zophobihabitans entericus]